MTWDTLREKLTTRHNTFETVNEYFSMPKDRRAEIKDVGGFVAGVLRDGRRKAVNVVSRSAITLDLDFAPYDFWDTFTFVYPDVAACLYSTHSHTPEQPRYRLIIPLGRDVSPDEYEAIARRVAGDLGIDAFDDTTFEPERLMYYPSSPKDGDWIGVSQDGAMLSADEVLALYRDWTDRSAWPISSRVDKVAVKSMKKMGDPTEKSGLVGVFCREYDIHQAIEKFLPDIYTPTAIDGRYTFTGGTSAGGLVVYDDLFAYSHHSTDPCCGKCLNAFDLVRLSLFGLQDEGVKADTPYNRLPSFKSMMELASKDEQVSERQYKEGLENAKEDFSESTDGQWFSSLQRDNRGNPVQSIHNVELILNNDPNMKGVFALNEFDRREIAMRDLAWRKVNDNSRALTDSDDAQLRGYLEREPYCITGRNVIQDGLSNVVHNNKFHPVKDYLNGLVWDGVPRINSLLPDYLGAEDNEYVQAVMRKVMVAAVSRIYEAGCKFDYMLTLVGAQGVGKSTFVRKLGKKWYSDSFGNIQGKEAFEAIQGVWVVEMGELAALRKAEFEPIKHFISKGTDRYRVAYGRRVEEFPRQCIFVGTTNVYNFLKDPTGNRRFWVVDVGVNKPKKSIWEIPEDMVDQLWAEAVQLYRDGETLFMDARVEEMARKQQEEHSEYNENTALVAEYLDELILPEDEWEKADIYERRAILEGKDDTQRKGTVRRNHVTPMEIWTELFNGSPIHLDDRQTKVIKGIMAKMDGWEYGRYYQKGVRVRGYVRIP